MSEAEYDTQSRGAYSDYDRYFAAMDKTMQLKLAITTSHFLLKPGAVIADMGCGSGLGSYQFAQLNPGVQVVGIDINPDAVERARREYNLPNLRFEVGDIENPDPALGPFDGILNSSVLHHVYSFNGYNRDNVVNALQNQMALLKDGGILVIRDFCAEKDEDFVLLDLQAEGGEGFTPQTMSDADLLVLFSKNARALAPEKDRGFFIEEDVVAPRGWRRFRLSAKWAAEFVLRKDYRADWDAEVLEEYGWWTPDDYRRELAALGGRVLYAAPAWNPWIVENRFRDRLRMYSESGAPRFFPATNFIAVVEKVPEGASLQLGERALSTGSKNYLQFSSWKDKESGEVFEMVSRPGIVADCVPYYRAADGRLMVYAKHGYPRPLVNTVPRGTPVLDEKHWSGHVVEPIAVADAGPQLAQKLAEKSGLAPSQFERLEEGLKYYPSPGMMDEIVGSVFAPVAGAEGGHAFTIPPDVSGFSTSGDVRAYPAQDLLRASQVGMMPEARLEMNIYALLRRLDERPDKWLGDEMVAPRPSTLYVSDIAAVLEKGEAEGFEPAEDLCGYLKYLRSVFADKSATTELARRELEFVIPAKLSANVASIAPLAADSEGNICIGLERRRLPAPQQREGDASICVLPAFRLPQAVVSTDKAAEFVGAKLLQPRRAVVKLGEAYFSSIGMTPERVHPFAVMLDAGSDVFQISEMLEFVPLREIFFNLEKIRDAHLLISSLRAIHALGLWGRL